MHAYDRETQLLKTQSYYDESIYSACSHLLRIHLKRMEIKESTFNSVKCSLFMSSCSSKHNN